MKILANFFFLLALLFSSGVFSAERSPIARLALDAVNSAYGRGGLTSVKALIEDCYKDDMSGIYCLYMDTVGRQIDAAAVDSYKIPSDPYFGDDQFLARVGPPLVKANLNMSEANAFLQKCRQEIESELGILAKEWTNEQIGNDEKDQAQIAMEEAAEAIRGAQLSAQIASLSGTAEGLYRGCKVDHDLRNMRDNSDPELALSLELMGQCINFVEGAAAVTFWEIKILRGCSNKGSLSRNQIIDGIVTLVKRDPLLIGAGQKREWLLRAALFDLSSCK